MAEIDLDHLKSAGQSAADDLLQKQREVILWNALQRVDDKQREIIVLRHFQGLSYQEIATVLAIPEGTVMSRLYRARKALVVEIGEKI